MTGDNDAPTYESEPSLRWPMKGMRREDGCCRIVYVLGTTRSGTSALRSALFQTRFKGFGEGHLDGMLSGIAETVRNHHKPVANRVGRNGRSEYEPDVLLPWLFRGYETYLRNRFDSDYLVDKTPTLSVIRSAPEFNRLHDDARFIFCARRHVDNVLSKIKKFPNMSFSDCCREWVSCNVEWQHVRAELKGNFLEFDFNELAADPAEISKRMADYLGLDRPRERKIMTAYLMSRRPQGSADRDLKTFRRLSETGWSEDQQAQFVEICGPVGKAMGYGCESYFRDGGTAVCFGADMGERAPEHPPLAPPEPA